MQPPFLKKRHRRYLILVLGALLSFIIVLGLPAIVHYPVKAQPVTIAQSNEQTPLHQGIQAYEAGQYTEAIHSWEQALQNNQRTPDTLTQALLLSNLSLAHQQLGQWSQATETLASSLKLLATPTDTPGYSETLAKALNTQGRLHWEQGNTEAALNVWREATTAYRQAGHDWGILLSLINQAKALQTLGFHVQAKTLLEDDIVQLLQTAPLDDRAQATGFWYLGNAQRQFGNLKLSRTNLERSLDIAQDANLTDLMSAVGLELGNTERALYKRAQAIGKRQDALTHKDAALNAYQTVAMMPVSDNQLQAKLNWLSFAIDLEDWSMAQTVWPDLTATITQLSPSRSHIYAQLNFAKSLTKVLQAPPNWQKSQPSTLSWQAIDTILVTATQQARTLDDTIAESYGIGQRGELYEIMHQWSKAEAFTQQALWLTNETQDLDGRYRWEWQQGRLLKAQGKQAEAITAYDAAVKTLEKVRKNLLFIDAEVQFSFRDNVEPIYRQLVELILSNENPDDPNQGNLDKAIQQIDSLQLSELENFLQCDLSKTTAISQFQADEKTAILYPMILEEQLTVILQLPNVEKTFSVVDIPKTEVEETLKELRKNLSKSQSLTPEVIADAKKVYNWLIRPFEQPLAQQSEIDTVVFVLDGALRNVPMAVLHDGEQYLVENYAIAIAPELELFTPQPFSQDLTVFTGGVGSSQQIEERNFPSIAKLDDELDVISELFGPLPPLTDEHFQPAALEQQLSTGQFSGIHIKTHGEFSSDPEETFIVAYETLIRGQELGTLIQSASLQGETPIELLVLSACSTATGDSRAILGLAGIAVRAGARSTVSTLWDARDIPNTELMIRFYEELKKTDTSRAQALQKAQLFLINRGYKAPHIWATYVLVGNWR